MLLVRMFSLLFGFFNMNELTSFLKKNSFLNKIRMKHHNRHSSILYIKHPLSTKYYEDYIKRLNSKNITIQQNSMFGPDDNLFENSSETELPKLRIFLNKKSFNPLNPLDGFTFEVNGNNEFNNNEFNNNQGNEDNEDDDDDMHTRKRYSGNQGQETKKSKNFAVIKNYPISFKDVGGYSNVKEELKQCVDILKNYEKYNQYNVRIPRGLILEGPPGNGKTLIAKAFAGESKCNFIPVSGSDFQEKYVGVGPMRIKELFELAKKNVPCVIFIDEIDALGRKRSMDGESSSNERDNTLNALLVEMDGFKNNTGIFIIGATNRVDLLDNALTRPGRIDKKIFIGLPDVNTRDAILNIHIKGKPNDNSIVIKDLIELTEGLSGAEIENLLNEAMLNALRLNKTSFNYSDIDLVMNKMMAGWQPNEHEFTSDIIDHIAIHEMGHAIVGILSKHHSKVSKVVINLYSPKSPGYTVFEGSTSNIFIREALFEHLMILLSGRIAEEVFYGVSVTTGAINDFEEALKLAQKMVVYYGMGTNVIYPTLSEKYKECIDNDVIELINNAYKCAEVIIKNCKDLIAESSDILKRDKILKAPTIQKLIETKYEKVLDLKIHFE